MHFWRENRKKVDENQKEVKKKSVKLFNELIGLNFLCKWTLSRWIGLFGDGENTLVSSSNIYAIIKAPWNILLYLRLSQVKTFPEKNILQLRVYINRRSRETNRSRNVKKQIRRKKTV